MSDLDDLFTQLLKQSGFDANDFALKRTHQTFQLTKWNLNYGEALNLQKVCLGFVRENPEIKIFIFCNHPPVYTLGRGLQKQKGGQPKEGLVEFQDNDENRLSFPLYKIKRGGGLTFHHPGQFIFYPIINLNKSDWNLNKHFHWLLGVIKNSLNSYYQTDKFTYDLCTAGVWREGRKYASVGVGVERFITYHGVALNIMPTNAMKKDLEHLHPCGLEFSTYAYLEKEFNNKLVDFLKDSLLE